MSTSEDIVTRCPQCNTAFRVTLNQLAVADGQVRCGSCLAVFKAMDHNAREERKSTTNPKPNTQKVSTQQTTTPKKASANKSSPHEEALNKPITSPVAEKSKDVENTHTPLKTDTKIEAEPTPKATTKKTQTTPQIKEPIESKESSATQKQSASNVAAPKQQTEIFTQEIEESSDAQEILIADEESGALDLDGDIFDLDSENKNKKTSLFDRSLTTVKEHKRESADESWAIKMLAELEEEEHQEEEKKTQFIIGSEPSENKDDFLSDDEPKIEPSFNLDDSTDDNLGFYDDDDEETNEQESSGYDHIDLNIDVETNDATAQPQDKDSPIYFAEDIAAEDSNNSRNYDLDSVLDDLQTAEELEETSISDDDIENAMQSRARYKDDPSSYLANIEPEPVEMVGLSSPSARRWLWRIGVVFLGVLFVLQIAIIRFDTLSKHPSYRSYYSSACNMLGCTLPSLIDTQKIRTTNLIVRSHPRQENALIIDAILINNARFTQPFPALRLEFNDINDKLVAKRQLQPDEYLRGELAGAKQMVNNQPIQLSIEIVDPGDTAVNYQLTVVQAKPKK